MDNSLEEITGVAERAMSPALRGSRIQIGEQSRERLVLFIPGGGANAKGLFVFAGIWNGFMTFFSIVMIGGLGQNNGPPWPMFAFVGLFWAIGIGLGWFAIKMRFERCLLLVEPTRAALKRTLFGRERTVEAELGNGSAASLVRSYEQNDVPVYAVSISGIDRTIAFGSQLSDPEKNWIVDHVNQVLGVTRPEDANSDGDPAAARSFVRFPSQCAQCGGALGSSSQARDENELTCPFCGHVYRGELVPFPSPVDVRQRPMGLFPSDRILIEEQDHDHLIFSMRAAGNLPSRLALGLFFLVFSLFWNGVTWAVIGGFLLAPGLFKLVALFALPFVAIGIVTAVIAAFVLIGRLRVTLDRDEFKARWLAGPFHYSRRFRTSEIDRVAVQVGPQQPSSPGGRGLRGGTSAVVWSGARWIPLMATPDANVARHVADLVRDQLREMDFALVDSQPDE